MYLFKKILPYNCNNCWRVCRLEGFPLSSPPFFSFAFPARDSPLSGYTLMRSNVCDFCQDCIGGSFAICRRSTLNWMPISKLKWLAKCTNIQNEIGTECVRKWSKVVLTVADHQSFVRFVFSPSMIGPLSININISAEIRLQANCIHPPPVDGWIPVSSFQLQITSFFHFWERRKTYVMPGYLYFGLKTVHTIN